MPIEKATVSTDLVIAERRKQLTLAYVKAKIEPEPNAPRWGLALSGGGIRSASFCLGLIKALAKNKLFHRFDLMSTVSGGGYAGAAVGKTYGNIENQNALEIEEKLANMEATWFHWWLRSNGRYLIPSGFKDMLQAMAIYIRNVLALHIELALLCILVGSIMAATHVAVWEGLMVLDAKNWDLQLVPYWTSTFWLPLVVTTAYSAALAGAYWVLPAKGINLDPKEKWLLLAYIIIITLTLLLLNIKSLCIECNQTSFHTEIQTIAQKWYAPLILLLILLISNSLGICISKYYLKTTKLTNNISSIRKKLTNCLSGAFKATVFFLTIGFVDKLAWWMAVSHSNSQTWLPLLLTGVLALVKIGAQYSQNNKVKVRVPINFLKGLAGTLGILVAVLLVAWWISMVYKYTIAVHYILPEERPFKLSTLSYLIAFIGLACFSYIFATRKNIQFLNISSLHMFYKARITRAFLGATNKARNKETVWFDDRNEKNTDYNNIKSVDEVVDNDDVAFEDYKPYAYGGPVHLVNCTINETRPANKGLFNQDRKGRCVSFLSGSDAFRINDDKKWSNDRKIASTSLGAWTAISGAAVAPGMGGQTSTGKAALLTMAGVRLGYWCDTGGKGWGSVSWSQKWLQNCFPKYAGLTSELTAKITGPESRYWYLSDGGHFDNTGVYALLRERCNLVVLADCGADPDYTFEDVENLVRKARIDLGVEIQFLTRRQEFFPTSGSNPFGAHIGSLSDLFSDTGKQSIALAQITYPNTMENSYLILVKPNIYDSLPVDIINYNKTNPSFPQETTTDQFFSEAQWESYFRLGDAIGSTLEESWINKVITDVDTYFEVGDKLSSNSRAEVKKDTLTGSDIEQVPAVISRFPIRVGAAVAGSTLGLGVLLTGMTALWQMKDQYLAPKLWLKQDAYKKMQTISSEIDGLNLKEGIQSGKLDDVVKKIKTFKQEYGGQVFFEEIVYNKHFNEAVCEINKECLIHLKKGNSSNDCKWLQDNASTPNFATNPIDPNKQAIYGGGAYLFKNDSDNWRYCREQPKPLKKPDSPRNSYVPNLFGLPSSRNSYIPNLFGLTMDSKNYSENICKEKIIYVHIYRSEDEKRAKSLGVLWNINFGAPIPNIENVNDSALKKGWSLPRPYTEVTVLHHTNDAKICAESIGRSFTAEKNWGSSDKALVKPLPERLPATPSVIEVWLPSLPQGST
jgi:Patatin-like phospholipase